MGSPSFLRFLVSPLVSPGVPIQQVILLAILMPQSWPRQFYGVGNRAEGVDRGSGELCASLCMHATSSQSVGRLFRSWASSIASKGRLRMDRLLRNVLSNGPWMCSEFGFHAGSFGRALASGQLEGGLCPAVSAQIGPRWCWPGVPSAAQAGCFARATLSQGARWAGGCRTAKGWRYWRMGREVASTVSASLSHLRASSRRASRARLPPCCPLLPKSSRRWPPPSSRRASRAPGP